MIVNFSIVSINIKLTTLISVINKKFNYLR